MTLGNSTEIIARQPALAGRFRVLEVLGQGGGSKVVRAIDHRFEDREVALKILTNHDAFDGHSVERFKEELRICRTLRHPNLVAAYDQIEMEGMLAFTMEFVKGKDLGSLLAKRKFQTHEAVQICIQVLSALRELHRHGIVHRDVKLENIILRDDGVAKLTDLGLMKSPGLQGLTRTGVLLGTAQYMPPEYVQHAVYDVRGDLYAVGIVLYELLTGRRRLVGKDGTDALEHLIKTRFQIARVTLGGVQRRYVPIIERATAVDPLDRYGSADEMLQALTEALHADEDAVEMKTKVCIRKLATQAPRKIAFPTNRRARLIALAATAALLAIAGVAVRERTEFITLPEQRLDGAAYAAGGTRPMQFIIGAAGLEPDQRAVYWEGQGCVNGILRIKDKLLQCEQGSYTVQSLSVSATGISGALRKGDKSYRIEIALPGAEKPVKTPE